MRRAPVLGEIAGEVQADRPAAAGDHDLVEQPARRPAGPVRDGPSRDSARTEQCGSGSGVAHRAALRHCSAAASMTAAAGGVVELPGRQIQMAEGLVGMFEADAAVHRGQCGLRRQRHRFVGADLFTADGDQPHVAAVRRPTRRRSRAARRRPGGRSAPGHPRIEMVEHRGDDEQRDRRRAGSTVAAASCRAGRPQLRPRVALPGAQVEHRDALGRARRRGSRSCCSQCSAGDGQAGHRRQRFGVGPEMFGPHRREREVAQQRSPDVDQVGPAVAGVGHRHGGDVGGQRVDERFVASARYRPMSGGSTGSVEQVVHREQQRRMRGQFDEVRAPRREPRPTAWSKRTVLRRLRIPVVGEVGARPAPRPPVAEPMNCTGVSANCAAGSRSIRARRAAVPARWCAPGNHVDLAGEQAAVADAVATSGGDGVACRRRRDRGVGVHHRQFQPARGSGDQRSRLVGRDPEHRHAVAARQPVDGRGARDDHGDGVGERDACRRRRPRRSRRGCARR